MTDTPQVEFISRYDGQPPSWLRSCFECEAMGCYPVKAHGPMSGNPDFLLLEPDDLSASEIAAVDRIIIERGFEEDGWYFIKCPDCGGSSRVSWLRTVLRLPRWIARGVPFIWQTRNFGEGSQWLNMWIAFKAAYLADLGMKM